ncbi:unnamed protein product, partial [Allacma fusca]
CKAYVLFPDLNYLLRVHGKWENFYQNLAYGFILNVNFVVDQLTYLMKRLSPRFLGKFEFYGTDKNKFIPQLLRKLPLSALPLPYKPDEKYATPVEFY